MLTIGVDVENLKSDFNEADASRNSVKIVTADHLQEGTGDNMSLPLIGMQFVMRYLVRCTEFCLVCHDKIPGDFEALKPYVCSKPLCLYQYMSLGFGPSIEHAILTQPYVVDLLISFCYSTAKKPTDVKLRQYPVGMSLIVPETDDVTVLNPGTRRTPSQNAATNTRERMPPRTVKFDESGGELLFPDSSQPCPISVGDWIMLSTASKFPNNARRSVCMMRLYQ